MFFGYKCFDKGLINRYGTSFLVGKEYHCDGEISFGNQGNGFHVCSHLEDTLRYFDAMNQEVDLTKVKCYGNFSEYEDDYYGYYDMYAFEYMIIEKILTREEVIDYGLHLLEIPVKRFISLFKLTGEEISLFQEKFQKDSSVLATISYYQEGKMDAFSKNKVLQYVKK